MPAFSTPLTLATARSYVRNYVLERTQDVGLITDAEANDLVNAAARSIWLRIATKYPDVFGQRSPANITVTTNNLPFTSIVTGGAGAGAVFRILNALVGPVGVAEGAMEQIHEFDKASARHVYEPGIGGTPTGLLAQPSLPYRWYVEGTTLYFTPQTTGNFDARVQWVQQPQDMTGDTDTIWQGQQAMYHDTVALLAAAMVLAKDGRSPSPVDGIFKLLDSSLEENFGSPRYPSHDQPRNPYAEAARNSRP